MNPTKEQLADPKWWDENAPEGATHIVPHTTQECAQCWVKQDGEDYFYSYPERNNLWFKWTTEKAFDAKNLFVKRPSHKTWSGPEDGLPPVGTVCEIAEPFQDAGAQVRVICHDDGAAICRVTSRNRIGDLVQLEASEISPIRTPEQIAAEERDKAIDRMLQEFYGMAAQNAAKIYDAGYRHKDTFASREAELLQALYDLAKAYRKYGLDVAHDPQLKKAEALLNAASN